MTLSIFIKSKFNLFLRKDSFRNDCGFSLLSHIRGSIRDTLLSSTPLLKNYAALLSLAFIDIVFIIEIPIKDRP